MFGIGLGRTPWMARCTFKVMHTMLTQRALAGRGRLPRSPYLVSRARRASYRRLVRLCLFSGPCALLVFLSAEREHDRSRQNRVREHTGYRIRKSELPANPDLKMPQNWPFFANTMYRCVNQDSTQTIPHGSRIR